MFGFIRTTIVAAATEQKRALPGWAIEAITLAGLLALLALGFAIRLWIYLPH